MPARGRRRWRALWLVPLAALGWLVTWWLGPDYADCRDVAHGRLVYWSRESPRLHVVTVDARGVRDSVLPGWVYARDPVWISPHEVVFAGQRDVRDPRALWRVDLRGGGAQVLPGGGILPAYLPAHDLLVMHDPLRDAPDGESALVAAPVGDALRRTPIGTARVRAEGAARGWPGAGLHALPIAISPHEAVFLGAGGRVRRFDARTGRTEDTALRDCVPRAWLPARGRLLCDPAGPGGGQRLYALDGSGGEILGAYSDGWSGAIYGPDAEPAAFIRGRRDGLVTETKDIILRSPARDTECRLVEGDSFDTGAWLAGA